MTRRRRRGYNDNAKGIPPSPAEHLLAREEVADYEYVPCEPLNLGRGLVWAHSLGASPPNIFRDILGLIEQRLELMHSREQRRQVKLEEARVIHQAKHIMTLGQWREYFARLEGPEGCDFRPDLTWKCAGGNDKSLSRQILANMGLGQDRIERVLEHVDSLGGHCDCEVLFNVAERIDP